MIIVLDKTSVPPSINSFEAEIQQEADFRIVEVIIRLVDKLEHIQNSSPEELLRIYVALKRFKHRFKKEFNRDFISPRISWNKYCDDLEKLNLKISQARRNYYAAKQPGN